MKRIYIAGPMSGWPDNNYPAFNAKAEELRAEGWAVENPAENPVPECGTWLGYMRMALRQLALCDAIYLLAGHETSRGVCSASLPTPGPVPSQRQCRRRLARAIHRS